MKSRSRFDVRGIHLNIGSQILTVDEYLDTITTAAAMHLPKDAELWIEPGRSLVAHAAVTLYRVITIKHGKLTFVARRSRRGHR